MATKLYVGNLSYNTTEEQIKELVGKSGTIASVQLISDKFSGRSKGFAFVEMENDEEAKKAIAEANGIELDGRTIVVNEARPAKSKGDYNRGGGGGGRSGGGFGGGGGGRGGKSRY